MVARLLSLRLDQLKDRLVKCNEGEFQTLQGEARALDKLYIDLTRDQIPLPFNPNLNQGTL